MDRGLQPTPPNPSSPCSNEPPLEPGIVYPESICPDMPTNSHFPRTRGTTTMASDWRPLPAEPKANYQPIAKSHNLYAFVKYTGSFGKPPKIKLDPTTQCAFHFGFSDHYALHPLIFDRNSGGSVCSESLANGIAIRFDSRVICASSDVQLKVAWNRFLNIDMLKK